MRALRWILLALIGSASACATPRPLPGTVPDSPSAEPASEVASLAPLRRADLIGTWGAAPDVEALWPKIDALMESGLDEETAVMFCFLTRIELREDGSGQFGMGTEGELDGAKILWQASGVSSQQVDVDITTTEGDRIGLLEVKRSADGISISGDPALGGLWVKLERGENGPAEDQLSHATALQYMEYRRTTQAAMVEVDADLVRRQESYELLATAVRTICEAEELLEDYARDEPAGGEIIAALKQALVEQEEALLKMPLPNAPQPPFQAGHEASAAGFDEAWLAGTWRFALDQLEWGEIMPAASAKEIAEIRAVLDTRRSSFEIRGPYRDVFGEEDEQETESGYHCLVPSPGAWCTLVISVPIGGAEEDMVEFRTHAARAYRVGDTMWLEEDPGQLVPWVRAD